MARCVGSNVANEQGTYVSFIVQRRQRAQWPAVIVAQCSLKARYTSVLYYQSGQIGALLRVLRATYSTLFSIPPFFAGHTPSNHYSISNIRGKKSE